MLGSNLRKRALLFPGAHVFKDADLSHTPHSQVRVMRCSVIRAVAIQGWQEQGAIDVGEKGKSSPLEHAAYTRG